MINKSDQTVNTKFYDCDTTLLVVYALGDDVLLRYRRTPEELQATINALKYIADTNPLFKDIFTDVTNLRNANL